MWGKLAGVFRTRVGTWFLLPVIGAMALQTYQWSQAPHSLFTPQATAAWTPSFWGSSTQAATGPLVEREFQVQGGYTTQSGLLLLNDRFDYRDPATVTAVVDSRKFPQVGVDARALVGRTIQVKGRQTTYKGKPQITVDQITIK